MFRASRVTRLFEWNDAWRNHPLISGNTRFSVMLPGFTWGLGAFAVFHGVKKGIEVCFRYLTI
jgi:hypothetical protein